MRNIEVAMIHIILHVTILPKTFGTFLSSASIFVFESRPTQDLSASGMFFWRVALLMGYSESEVDSNTSLFISHALSAGEEGVLAGVTIHVFSPTK